MKAEFDREIDALLRRSARAAGWGARAPQDGPATPHLDADELSAFAENALPAPARLAAVSHLADCDACRGAVVTLSGAAGAGVELEKRAAVPTLVDPSEAVDPSEVARGGWFAALFSPRLLRFVAPALALCLVAAVAFVALRTRQDAGSSVAQHSAPNEAARPDITTAGPGAGANMSVNLNANVSTGTTADTTANVAPQGPAATSPHAADQEHTSPAPVVETPDGADAGGAGARQPPTEAVRRDDAVASPPPPAAATESGPVAAAPSPPPAPEARDEAKQKKEDDRKAAAEDEQAPGVLAERRAQQNSAFETQQTPDGSRGRSANNTYGGTPPAAKRAPERSRSARSITAPVARGGGAARGEAADREEAEPAGETREAAGHRFRREGSAWVDVKYRPSMSMTGVRRGTESFRALVADIPKLGRIAQQLSGEVIAVIDGRAYRIR